MAEPDSAVSGSAAQPLLSFDVQANHENFRKHDERPRNIHKPQEITEFSYDDDRKLHLDARSLAYYYPALEPQNVYLDEGFEHFRRVDDSIDEHLAGILGAIMNMEKKLNVLTKTHFISYRGMMTNLLASPYSWLDEWEMKATFFDGTIFVEENKAAKAATKNDPKNNRRDNPINYFYGFKFETLFTIPDTWDNVSREEIEDRNSKVVSNYAQYCSVVKTGIGNIDIVIGGEVDAIWDAKIDGHKNHNYVELKTTTWIDPSLYGIPREKQEQNYDRRKLKYWAQSYLIGCPRVLVGKRHNKENRLMGPLEEFRTLDIPSHVKSRSGVWDSGFCVKNFAALLEWLHEHIKDTKGVWRIFKHRSDNTVYLSKASDDGHDEILTQEFINHRIELRRAIVAQMVDQMDTS